MKLIHLITVGKLKNKNILLLEKDYLKRFKDIVVKIHEVKSHKENLRAESQEVITKIKQIDQYSKYHLILLTEKGITYESSSFSKWLYKKLETTSQIIFIIGGASGHGKELYQRPHEEVSLSPLTFPHQIARLLFIEQLYRAESIFTKHPYHK